MAATNEYSMQYVQCFPPQYVHDLTPSIVTSLNVSVQLTIIHFRITAWTYRTKADIVHHM